MISNNLQDLSGHTSDGGFPSVRKVLVYSLVLASVILITGMLWIRIPSNDMDDLINAAQAGDVTAMEVQVWQRRITISDPKLIKYLFLQSNAKRLASTAEAARFNIRTFFYGSYGRRWGVVFDVRENVISLGKINFSILSTMDDGYPTYVISLTEPIPGWVEEIRKFVYDPSPNKYFANQEKRNVLNIEENGEIHWEWDESLVH